MDLRANLQRLFHPRRTGVSMLMACLLSAGLYVGVKGYSTLLAPGPLSAVQEQGTELGGYGSHAEFEQECGHCHAPVHCITASRCQECHLDVAQDRMTAVGLHGRLPANQCQDCHVEHQGREAVITEFAFRNVDHEKLSGFSLADHQVDYGNHPLSCDSCHSQDRFRSKTLDCISCHADADHDFIAEHIDLYGTDCVPCHDGQDRMTGFSHEAAYPLTGGHELLECGDCHANAEYYQAPRACEACHVDPEIHMGVFGTDCQRCHTAQAWQPAKLTRHLFALDHGGEVDQPCERCHTETYAAYNCYECHDHDPEADRRLHEAEGLPEYADCEACHPTGAAGEAAHYMEIRSLNDPYSRQTDLKSANSAESAGQGKRQQKDLEKHPQAPAEYAPPPPGPGSPGRDPNQPSSP